MKKRHLVAAMICCAMLLETLATATPFSPKLERDCWRISFARSACAPLIQYPNSYNDWHVATFDFSDDLVLGMLKQNNGSFCSIRHEKFGPGLTYPTGTECYVIVNGVPRYGSVVR